MSQRIARVIPLTSATDIRGARLAERPCPTAWPDGRHAMHQCEYMITRYAPAAPMKDGWIDDLHDGPHRCACGAELADDA